MAAAPPLLIVGERLNSTRRAVREALERRDDAFLLDQARRQAEAGAAFIDLNAAALLDGEIAALTWAVPLLQDALGVSLSIDSPNPAALEAGLAAHRGRAFLNSVTAEPDRLRWAAPLVRTFGPRIAALCLDERGLPGSVDDVLRAAGRLVDSLTAAGAAPDDIYLDPLVRPVGAEPEAAALFLDSLAAVRARFPGARTIAGLSNVSFGMPERRLLNRTMLALALGRGLDAAVCDPLDGELMGVLKAAETLLAREGSIRGYLAWARSRT